MSLTNENKIQSCDEWEILKLFFDQKSHTIEEILENRTYHKSTIRFHLRHLINENIIIKIKNEYILSNSFSIAEKIVQKCSKIESFESIPQIRFNENKIRSFAKSIFFKDNLNKFTKNILKKFNIFKKDKESIKIIEKTIAISPSAISYCFGEFDRIWGEGEYTFEHLMQTLSILILIDCMNLRISLFQDLSNDNKLIFINPQIEIKYALRNELYLQLKAYPTNIVIAKLKEGHGIMLRGSLLTSADDIILNDMGNLFMSSEQYEKAIEILKII